MQVYCSESGTEKETLKYTGDNSYLDTTEFKDLNGNSFSIQQYDGDSYYTESTVTITSDLPDKTCYVFQPDEDWNEKYVGSFNIKNSTLLRKILINNENNNVTIAELIADCGLDTTGDEQATYSPSADWTSVYDAKGNYNYNMEDPAYSYWENHGNDFSDGNASYILNLAGFDFNAATYQFVGLKQKTYYKYGEPKPLTLNSNGVGYISGLSVILPTSNASGSRSYIAVKSEGQTDEEAMSNGLTPINRRSLSGVLGIPGNAGTIMTFDPTGTSGLYVPLNVNVHYAVEAPSGATLTNDGGLNNHTDTVTDNTQNPYIQSDTFKSMSFQPDINHTVPQCTIGGETKDATGWESVNDSDKIFGLSSNSPVIGIFSATNYNVTFDDGLIILTVPVKAMFPTPQTYTVTYSATDEKGAVIDLTATEYGDTYAEQSYTAGSTVTVADKLAKDGYYFNGWKKDGTVVTTFTMPSDNVGLTGRLDKLFTLKFDANGGSAISDSQFAYSNLTAAEKTAEKRTFSVTDPTRTGYTFKGWSLDGSSLLAANEVALSAFALNSTSKRFEATVKALWEKDYTLEYYDGDTKLDGTQTAAYSDSFSGIIITKDNLSDTAAKTFLGWADAKNATAKQYDKGSNVPKAKFDTTNRIAKIYAVWQDKTYTVTYHANGGTGADYTTDPIAYGGSHTVLAVTDANVAYTRTGYTFTGWNTAANGGETAYAAGDSIENITANVDLYAQWKKEYTLHYHANLSDVTAPGSVTFFADDTNISGGKYTFENKTVGKTGYTFKGWGTAANATETVTAIDFNESTDTYDVYGVWQNTVTYQDGYTGDPANDKTYDVITGQSHTVIGNPYTRTGYTFKNWELVSPASGYATSGSITVNENVTYRATWDVNKNDVKYELTGTDQPTVTLPATKKDVEYRAEVTDIADKLTATGYTFSGWKVKSGDVPAADITNDANGNVTKFIMPDKDVTLQGTFTKNTYKVHYVLTGENQPSVSVYGDDTVTFGDDYTVKNKLTADGYTFMGWTVKEGVSDSAVTKNSDNTAKSFPMPAGDVTLQGTFTLIPLPTFTVTYHANGGTGNDFTTDPITGGGSHTVLAVTDANVDYIRTGYTFTGWNTAANGGGTAYAAGDSIENITANVDLYAQWEKDYTLEYYDGDTKLDGTQTAAYSDSFSGIAIAKDNLSDTAAKTFLGWADAKNAAAKQYDKGSNVPTEKFDTTTRIAKVYAVWQDKTFTVTYRPGEGSGSEYKDTDKSGNYTLLGTSDVGFTAPAGKEFNNWQLVGPDGKGYPTTAQPGDSITVISDVTYEAQWKASDPGPGGYTVTYTSGLDKNYPGYDESCANPFKDENVTLDSESKYAVLPNNIREQTNPSFNPAYEFAGWRIAGSSGGASHRPNGAAPRSGAGTDGIIAAGDKITLSGDITLKGVWKCKLTYDANGGSPASAVPNSGNAIDHYVDDKVTVQDGSGLKNGDLVFAYWSTT